MKNIYLIVGESGSGKSTIANILESEYGMRQLPSYTTRVKRSIDEKGHIFVLENDFSCLKNVVAYSEYEGFKYCATNAQIEQNDIYIIDPAGVQTLRDSYKGNKHIITIFIHVPENERKQRMYSRGDKKLKVAQRLSHDKTVFNGFHNLADVCFENKEPYECAKKIAEYIQITELKENV